MTDDLTRLIDRYCDGWNEPDPAQRLATLESVMTPDCVYCDPKRHAPTPAALSDLIGEAMASRPAGRVVRLSAVEAHHHVARFLWAYVDGAGNRLVGGVDFVAVAADGRLASVTGFFGDLAEG